jgi:WhiB family redox-sensing transcriptional regulator
VGHRDFIIEPKATPSDAVRQLCGRCPVREECLAFALADESLTGVWDGTNERERRAWRKAKRGVA